jgi:hypothetical protein
MRVLFAIAIIVGVLLYLRFGTLSPCGMLREDVRRHDSMAAALPDALVDLALIAQYGALSPERCISILINGLTTPVAATPKPQQAKTQQQAPPNGAELLAAAKGQAETAMYECRAKRLSGEIKTHAGSAQCSNPLIMRAYSAANYRYMDLIAQWTAKRIQIADKIDRRELTEAQADFKGRRYFAEIMEAERRRDNASR